MVTDGGTAGAVSVSVSVALLLPGVGSVTPAGGDTRTVLLIVPVAFGLITPLSVMNTLWPLGRLSPLHSPLPESKFPAEGMPKVGFNKVLGIESIRVTLPTVPGPFVGDGDRVGVGRVRHNGARTIGHGDRQVGIPHRVGVGGAVIGRGGVSRRRGYRGCVGERAGG